MITGNAEQIHCSDMIINVDRDSDESAPLDSRCVGKKAVGLGILPRSWRPPFAVLTTALFEQWRSLGEIERALLLESAGDAIFYQVQEWAQTWSRGIILRSSAVNETLSDRGALDSFALAADFDAQKIAEVLEDIFTQSEMKMDMGGLAVVVQPLVPSGFLGHMSNERRISKTVNHWMWETDAGEGRFNSQRSNPPAENAPLTAPSQKDLLSRFRAVGRWCTELGRGPTHLEWSWDHETLWLLQLDFEDESPDDGVDPREAIRGVDDTPSLSPPVNSLLKEVDLSGSLTGWNKIDKVREFVRVRDHPFPRLFFVEGSAFPTMANAAGSIEADLEHVAHGRVVCRTDCKSGTGPSLNLPRTDSVSPADAVAFMRKTLDELIGRGVQPSDICFIIHKFIPAIASAWALAEPESQFVQIDSLWGVPDGLQFLAHDSFEFDIRRDDISSERLRYKSAFIQETVDGTWREVHVSRRIARHRSLRIQDLREIAHQSARLAKDAGEPRQIMWFCGIPERVGIGRNLPWFMIKAEIAKTQRHRISPPRSRIVIKNESDLDAVQLERKHNSMLVLEPDVALFRDDTFLDHIVSVARTCNLPVELHGSTLGHAHYVLAREKVTIVPADEAKHTRVRRRQVFEKVVRDEIPTRIEQKGERVVLARIAKSESRAALLAKLMEEIQELKVASSPEDVLAELADVHEVIRSLSLATGVEWEQVERAAEEKRSLRGSFEKGVVLLETAWPSRDHPLPTGTREISLKTLARLVQIKGGFEMTYPTLFAAGADNTATLPSGTRIRISLTGSGIRIEEDAGPDSSGTQLNLPFGED